MRTGAIPFQIDLGEVLATARRWFAGRVGDVSFNLPFVSFSISPKDREKKIAREIVIRLHDKRVLSAWEYSDDRNAVLESLLRCPEERKRSSGSQPGESQSRSV